MSRSLPRRSPAARSAPITAGPPPRGRFLHRARRCRRGRPPRRGSAARRNASSRAGKFPPGGGSCSAPQALDRWIREALANSPTLGAAEATLAAGAGDPARPLRGPPSQRRRERLRVPAEAVGGLVRADANLQINPFTLYNASVDVSYTLDLFGRTRRELEALQAQVDYQRFPARRAPISRSPSNIVTAAFQEASLRGQLQATRDILATQEEQLALVEKQFELGGIARTDVLAQRALPGADPRDPAPAGETARPDAPPAGGPCRQVPRRRGGSSRIRPEGFSICRRSSR